MDRGLRERVRWGNVGRAVVMLGVVVLVVAWPLVAPEGPRVPGGRVEPLVTRAPVAVTPAPTAVVTPTPTAVAPPVVRGPKRRRVRGERRAGEGGGGSGRRRRQPAAPGARVAPAAPLVVRPAPVVPRAAPPPAAVQGAPAPADPDPVLREFGPEGG